MKKKKISKKVSRVSDFDAPETVIASISISSPGGFNSLYPSQYLI